NIRSNFSWESMGLQLGGASAWTMNQEVLTTDGAQASLATGGLLRAQKFDSTMKAIGQYAYPVDGNNTTSNWVSMTSSGVSDILVLPDGTPIALERAIGRTDPLASSRM